MRRFRKRVDPVDHLFKGFRSSGQQQFLTEAQRSSERQQRPSRSPTRSLSLPRDDFDLVAVKHGVPPVASLVREPVDFLRIQGRQPPRDSLAPEVVLLSMTAHVARDGLITPLDAEFFAARLLDEFPRVPKPNGQELHESRRILLLPGIIPFFAAPFDEAGPAR